MARIDRWLHGVGKTNCFLLYTLEIQPLALDIFNDKVLLSHSPVEKD